MYCRNCGDTIDQKTTFCKKCGTEVIRHENFKHGFIAWLGEYKWILVGVVVAVGLIVLISDDTGTTDTPAVPVQAVSTTPTAPADVTSADQNTIASFEANIICGDSGGSGTVMSSDGLVLTNNHIIPEDRDGNPTVAKCIVTLPDEQGKIDRIYYGEPVVVTDLSEKYDLAFININEAYTDDDGVKQGEYPTKFANFYDSGCSNDDPRLGEAVRVFGYPAISAGGYYLTITSGIVSSLPNDGTIFTSAKVDHGDSGGIAVDEKGCMIGVPSMISGDGNESLGVIISNSVVAEFLNKVNDLMNASDSSTSTN